MTKSGATPIDLDYADELVAFDVEGIINAGKRRRWQRRAVGSASAVVIAIAAVTVFAVINPNGRPPSSLAVRQGDAELVNLDAEGTPYGFSVEMTVSFAEDRAIQSAAFELERKGYPAELYPNDGTEVEVQRTPLPVAAGVAVMMSAKITPTCSGPYSPPLLVVRSQVDGSQERKNVFTASNPGDYTTALNKWCATTVQATVAASSITPAGEVTVRLRLVNPQSRPVIVSSTAYDAGGTHWNPATIRVPASGSATLVITATDGSCTRTQTPWNSGRLTANGEPVDVTQGTDWC